jgi:glutamine synthetase
MGTFMNEIQKTLEAIRTEQALMVDFRFTDLLGGWRHISLPADLVDQDVLESGVSFDASSLAGWQGVEDSDMLLRPDLQSMVVDPYRTHKTIAFVCSAVGVEDRVAYGRDPRSIAERAVAHMRAEGIADEIYCGPEPEFSILDEAYAETGGHQSSFRLRSEESFEEPSSSAPTFLRHRIDTKQGYLAQAPADAFVDIRAEVALALKSSGIPFEASHHEVGAAGQSEIPIRFASLVKAADQLMLFKYTAKSVLRRHNKIATFMPKPIAGDNGNGMHVHQSLWRDGKPLFAGDGYAGLSQHALWYIGGILHHARALCAFANPTTNSYRRLIEGFEAPVYLCYGAKNRSAAVRIPMRSSSPKSKRIEVRFGDPSANPYLMFAAFLQAGLDGIRRRIEPPQAIDQDVFTLPQSKLQKLARTPRDLREALDALAQDHAFLVHGDVFAQSAIDAWIEVKTKTEIDVVQRMPTPSEYRLYMDC